MNGDNGETGFGAPWADVVPELVQAVLWGLWSFLVFSGTVSLLFFDAGSLGYYLCLMAWVLSSVVMWWPISEREVARRLHGLRTPSVVEAARLQTAWTAVNRRAGPSTTHATTRAQARTISLGKLRITLGAAEPDYRLWVVDAGAVPTTPATTVGYPVAVTRWAVHSLPPTQLEAVVAHQLGYQLVAEWRRELASMVLWFSLPARGFVTLGRRVWPVLRRVPVLGCLVGVVIGGGILTLIVTSALFGDLSTALGWTLLIASPLWAPPLFDLFDRQAERRADRVAAHLGYGPALLDTLYAWQQRDIEHSPPGRRPAATHRIAALESLSRN